MLCCLNRGFLATVPQNQVATWPGHVRRGCRPELQPGEGKPISYPSIMHDCQNTAPDLTPYGTCLALTKPPPTGIKAHTAERHWRPSASARYSMRVGMASKPTQPKGIGDGGGDGDVLFHMFGASKPTQPKGIGDERQPREWRGWRRRGIKAHTAERHWRLVVGWRSRKTWAPASKPTQPKGIGDERFSFMVL